METDPGIWCRADNWGCMIYEEASEVEGVAVSAAGIGCRPLPVLEFKFEPASERDQACLTPWPQAFRLLLKSWTLARYHRPELTDLFSHQWCNPATALLKNPPLPPDTTVSLAICLPQSPAPGETQYQLNTLLTAHTWNFLIVIPFPLLGI